MRVSWIKSEKDKDSFNVVKNLGFNVIELKDLEKTDMIIEDLVNNKYRTIIMSNEVAGFSEDIIKKYAKEDSINIIIAPSKK